MCACPMGMTGDGYHCSDIDEVGLSVIKKWRFFPEYLMHYFE